MATSIRKTAGVAVRRAGLTRPAFRVLERTRALKARGNPKIGQDGLPLPPPLLMIRVVGHADAVPFQRYGRRAAEIISDAAGRHGQPITEMDAVLDFGCGCGRVARHWPTVGAPAELHGCDYNAAAIRWLQDTLPFLDARVNQLAPPLPYPDGKFDLIYLLSVFTHLDEATHHAWMGEFRRILKPGGLLLFTIKGEEHAREQLDPARFARFHAGEFVVIDEAVQGTNLCAAYANPSWVRARLLDGLELLEQANYGADLMGGQDAYLARKA